LDENKVLHFQADSFQKENFLPQISLKNKISERKILSKTFEARYLVSITIIFGYVFFCKSKIETQIVLSQLFLSNSPSITYLISDFHTDKYFQCKVEFTRKKT